MRTFSIIVLISIIGAAQAQKGYQSHSPSRYSNLSLGFSYTPLNGMRDETDALRSQIREEEKASRTTTKAHVALLAMFSGENGSDPNWRSLSIETCPRNAFPDADDASAEAKMSSWLAHSQDTNPASNKSVVVSGQKFSISLFAVQDGPVRKGAAVWTTIRKGRFLSFFFAANSPEQLKELTETMKTLEFY